MMMELRYPAHYSSGRWLMQGLFMISCPFLLSLNLYNAFAACLFVICLNKNRAGEKKAGKKIKRDALENQCRCLLLPVAEPYDLPLCLQVSEPIQITRTVKLLQ